MLISPDALSRAWGVAPQGVLHIGAHDAEEDPLYRQARWGPVTWVEAMPVKADSLRQRFHDDPSRRVVEALAWDRPGVRMDFRVASNGMSSSVFAPGTHTHHHPAITFDHSIQLESVRLDEVLPGDAFWDFINVDVQGAELHALRGLGSLLQHGKWIYMEVNEEPVYTGCPLIDEVDRWLLGQGFERLDAVMTPFGWGDALYASRDVVPKFQRARRAYRWAIARRGDVRAALRRRHRQAG